MNKAIGTVISANTMRLGMGLDPIRAPRHKLKIWPNDDMPDHLMRFACVKCKKGGLVIERKAVRSLVSGEPGWDTYFTTVAWGSWRICREDAPPTTPDWRNT